MPVVIKPAPVRKQLTVKAPPERAFEVFTAMMGKWWKPEHHTGEEPFQDIVVEPRPGGRWFERDAKGVETMWGKVLAWEPPSRLLLAWQLNADFRYDPDFLTEVELRFLPEG